ncbi:diacylglycerol/lipid kinase family protein [Aestuariivirga litoralis]|uniref:diacylglycerol/lipid kinase family protein n=1 Tax=Aestuariivirga litoralis TaxID=2650924 RepID=UPI0018C52177|nr:diacylglycerol kinase family protein [Aestuariivirga litoralis]MBG1231748.1 hypothetical protein [Aestuariivirga litoralis]
MAQKRSALVLINQKSGTVRTLGPDVVKANVEKALSGAFEPLAVELVDGDVTTRAQAAAKSKECDIIIAGGGDGSISSVANVLRDSTIILGALPLGTMNTFVQDLGFSPKLELALQQLADARVTEIDAGEINGRLFLHQVSFGVQPRMARLRERLGYKSRFQKMLGAARAYLAIFRRPQNLHVNVKAGETEHEISAPFVAVTNNPAALPKQARALDQGILGFYVVHSISASSILRLAAAFLTGKLDEAEQFDRATSAALTMEARARRSFRIWGIAKKPKSIQSSIDGEVALLDFPVKMQSLPRALRVLSVAPQYAKTDLPVKKKARDAKV